MANRGGDKEYAVIGLGSFGASVARTLTARGFRVMGIDVDQGLVQQYSDVLTHTVALDASDEEALQAIDIGAFDTVIISMAEHFEGSILATVAVKHQGVRCVICKALSERQAEILLRIGADQVVLPEKEAGQRLALELAMPEMLDSMDLGAGYSVVEVNVPDWLINRSLAESNLRERFGVTVLVIKSGENMIVSPPAAYVFHRGDLLVVIGPDSAITQISNHH